MILTGIFGKIDEPLSYTGFNRIQDANYGLVTFISNLIILIIVISGIFTIVNFIIAGYQYLSANGNAQTLAGAGTRMLNTIYGIVVISATFIIASIIGYVFFQDAGFLLNPTLRSLL